MERPDTAPIPNLRHLFAAVEVARHGGIGRAAAAIHLSQSAVTQAMTKLEASLGSRLFDRAKTGISLTGAGNVLIARITRAQEALKAGGKALPGNPALHRLATTTQLRCLAAVVDDRGFSIAARALRLTQQSVYRAVHELEGLCGQSLFVRTSSGLEPNREAHALARAAGLAFAEIRQGMDELREIKGLMDGRLAVGCLPLARTHLLPAAATRLLTRFPDVRLQIVDGPYAELLHGLRHGRLDLIIGALREPPPASDIQQATYFHEALSIIVRAGHPVLAAPAPNAAALAALDWIVPREGTPARGHFNDFFRAAGVEAPRRMIECSSLVAARGLLLQSDRAAILSLSQVRYEILSLQLAALTQLLPGSQRPIGLTTRAGWTPTRMQSLFLEELACVVREDMQPGLAAAQSKPDSLTDQIPLLG